MNASYWAAQMAQSSNPQLTAERRAFSLLWEHLTPMQQETLVQRGYVPVDVRRLFGLWKWHFRVEFNELHRDARVRRVSRSGKKRMGYCIHVTVAGVPWPDRILSHVLMLRHSPWKWRRIANGYPG